MRLVWFEVTGYKRFAKHTKVNLNEKLVAIVGPNEAGKTSLLRCLLHFNHRQAFVDSGGSQEVTRGIQVADNETVAEWTFALDEDDRQALCEIPEAQNLRWCALHKKKSGKVYSRLTPRLRRSLGLRQALQGDLARAIEEYQGADADQGSEDQHGLIESLKELSDSLESENDDLAKETLDRIAAGAAAVRETEFEPIAERLTDLHVHESEKSPSTRVGEILEKRIPQILFFSDENRDLASEYDLNEYFREVNPKKKIFRQKIPIALQNLAHASQLDLEDLHAAQANDDRGKVKTLLERAENKLTGLLRESWSQDQLSLSLELDGYRFQVLLRSENSEYVKVIERSDGLRQFVAMLLFLACQGNVEVKPILLIDELESHLHYDAQADLVQVLAEQPIASKVIYTTHSAGCLPEDLGSGIRMIATDDPHSTIENYFWTSERPGFSPLLFAMGAQTLAFLPMRYALIAEGAADLILVPAILKAGLNLETLGFQVVPGLSSGKSEEIAILDSESARTAYLVDGDDAGRRMKEKVVKAGVAEEMIISLPHIDSQETVIEDYLRVQAYRAAVAEELRRSGCHEEITDDDLSWPNRPRRLEEWCNSRNVRIPSKRVVAYHVIDSQFESPIIDDAVTEQIKILHKSIVEALQVQVKID